MLGWAAVGRDRRRAAGRGGLRGRVGPQRDDAAGQLLAPVPGLCSTTASGLARRFTDQQWAAVEAGVAAITARMLALVPAAQAVGLTEAPTIDIDTTDMEVYGRRKRPPSGPAGRASARGERGRDRHHAGCGPDGRWR